MGNNADAEQQIIESFARKLADGSGNRYADDPQFWQAVASVALTECSQFIKQAPRVDSDTKG